MRVAKWMCCGGVVDEGVDGGRMGIVVLLCKAGADLANLEDTIWTGQEPMYSKVELLRHLETSHKEG